MDEEVELGGHAAQTGLYESGVEGGERGEKEKIWGEIRERERWR